MLSIRNSFIGLVILGLIVACAVNPVTGKKELSLVGEGQELAIGAQQYKPSQQSQGGLYYIDPALQSYVARVGQKLAAVSDKPNLPYEFVVLNSSVPNAWALPGGKIAINRGLLVQLNDEAELAAVLGHEIVHAAARHGAAQMSKGMLVNIGTQIVNVASQSNGYGQLAQLGGAMAMASYGRQDELESDHYGMKYMVKAGYDPRAAIDLQKTFVKLSEGRQPDFVSGLFASHPPSQERVNANKAHAAKLNASGVRNKAAYQRMIAQLKRDEAAYKTEKDAVKALKAKDFNKALQLSNKAIGIQPRESSFYELKAFALHHLKQNQASEAALSKAISVNPQYFKPRLMRGLLRDKMGNKVGARQDIAASYKILPTKAAKLYLQGPAQ